MNFNVTVDVTKGYKLIIALDEFKRRLSTPPRVLEGKGNKYCRGKRND